MTNADSNANTEENDRRLLRQQQSENPSKPKRTLSENTNGLVKKKKKKQKVSPSDDSSVHAVQPDGLLTKIAIEPDTVSDQHENHTPPVKDTIEQSTTRTECGLHVDTNNPSDHADTDEPKRDDANQLPVFDSSLQQATPSPPATIMTESVSEIPKNQPTPTVPSK